MNLPLIVTYYTPEYVGEATGLLDTAAKFSLEIQAHGVRSLGSWQANTQAKADFLCRMCSLGKRQILYLDADARIRRPLDALSDWMAVDQPEVAMYVDPEDGPRSGTIWFAPSPIVAALFGRWRELCWERPDTIDQILLWEAIKQAGLGLRYEPLPIEACWIFDTDRQRRPDRPPIIEHMQASRRLKAVVNGTEPT